MNMTLQPTGTLPVIRSPRVLGCALLVGLLGACGGSGDSSGSGSSGSSANLDVNEISTGFGKLVPHTVFEIGVDGFPTNNVVEIRSQQDLIDNVRTTNPVRRVVEFPEVAFLPGGEPGNQFIYVNFTQPISLSSVIDHTVSSQVNFGLAGPITVVAVDPVTEETSKVAGRVFVGGRSYPSIGLPPSATFDQKFPLWVSPAQSGSVDCAGDPLAFSVKQEMCDEAEGFPGTESVLGLAEILLSPNTLVFVADSDGDLSTHETFPAGVEIQMRVDEGSVFSTTGRTLVRDALGSTTVGGDGIPPRVPGVGNSLKIIPGNNQIGVDPLTTIELNFSEPVQPASVGSLFDGSVPTLSSAVQIMFGPDTARVDMPFSVRPFSVLNLSRYELIPSFNFPGQGPVTASCGTFSVVTIMVNSGPAAVTDISVDANLNVSAVSTEFETGEAPGIINAPVAPDTIYVGRSSGLSVIDLNGFGAGTGSPVRTINPDGSIAEGSTQYPINPNVILQGAQLQPPLQPGTCTIDGGSAGVFTLTKDSSLSDTLVMDPILLSIDDAMLGQALDTAFNNATLGGCQAGGGNNCAANGLKSPAPVVLGNVMAPALPGQFSTVPAGQPNIISWAPSPNPPPLRFPPLCLSPQLLGEEPTSVTNTANNLLQPGNPFGNPLSGVAPSGLLTVEVNTIFGGPALETPTVQACPLYRHRQQVGHFLYVIDRARGQVVVLNSNRMTVIDRITTPDPTTLAMSPNLGLLAVTNQRADLVSFIDINPNSGTFHEVITQTIVGSRPRGVAWEPENEDILVCNELDNSVSVISAQTLTVRKVIQSQLNQPFDIAVTERQLGFAFQRNVYFGWILNRNGKVALFESGPNGVNGWGFDDVIGVAEGTFQNPKAIQPDHLIIDGGVWIVHEGPIDILDGAEGQIGEGAISQLVIESALVGQLPLNFTSLLIPQFRDINLAVRASIGQEQLSGIPTDLAFDNMRNISALPNNTNVFSSGAPVPVNGKSLIRFPGPAAVNTNEASYLFLSVPNPFQQTGVVDVIDLNTNRRIDTNLYRAGINSIDAEGAQFVVDYFRQ